MDKTISKLTVFFEDPFWVGIYERSYSAKYEVCKIIFGAEPKDYDVYEFILKKWCELRFSPSIGAATVHERRINPKRIQRIIKKQLQDVRVGTKAQQALKLQQEQGKLERKQRNRKQREAEEKRQFELRQKKHKAKHRGH